MNPISRIAPVTDAEAAQMVHPDTLADLAERLISTPVEAAATEDAAGNPTWQPPRRSRGWHAPGLVHRGPGPRRWPGWLAPVAAAAAVVGVIIGSLAISGVILHHPAGPAGSSGVFAKVPRYFVAIPEVPRHRGSLHSRVLGEHPWHRDDRRPGTSVRRPDPDHLHPTAPPHPAPIQPSSPHTRVAHQAPRLVAGDNRFGSCAPSTIRTRDLLHGSGPAAVAHLELSRATATCCGTPHG
jgi:hypothetical protein